jgi:hypothetical protein
MHWSTNYAASMSSKDSCFKSMDQLFNIPAETLQGLAVLDKNWLAR